MSPAERGRSPRGGGHIGELGNGQNQRKGPLTGHHDYRNRDLDREVACIFKIQGDKFIIVHSTTRDHRLGIYDFTITETGNAPGFPGSAPLLLRNGSKEPHAAEIQHTVAYGYSLARRPAISTFLGRKQEQYSQNTSSRPSDPEGSGKGEADYITARRPEERIRLTNLLT